jgi:ribosomal-protein-alanine N-acetyltransferase
MHVTPIEPRDHEAVATIALECQSEIDLSAELERKWARIWVAKKTPESEPLGFVLAWLVADEVHVIHVATRPSDRRKGVAAALLCTVVSSARSERARLVLLEVRRSNRAAIRLYRSQGFHAIGVRRGYYAENAEDAIEMVLAFDPSTGEALPGEDQVDLDSNAKRLT